MGSGSKRLLGTNARFEATLESTESGIRLNQRASSETKSLGCSIVSLVGFGAEDSTARDVIMRGETEPGGKVLGGGPANV
jgi:hypothetical protein